MLVGGEGGGAIIPLYLNIFNSRTSRPTFNIMISCTHLMNQQVAQSSVKTASSYMATIETDVELSESVLIMLTAGRFP